MALIACSLAAATTAQAQPAGDGSPPCMVPGPMNPEMAPPGPPQSDCLSIPANIPNAFTEECVPPDPCLWFDVEYLLWDIKSPRFPSTLVTTNPSPPPGNNPPTGELGDPNTIQNLRSNSLKSNPLSGVRLNTGVFLDSHNGLSLEAVAFFLPERSSSFKANSDATGRPLIFVPFYDIQGLGTGTGPGEFGFGVAIPDFRVGGVAISSSSQLWGAEANLVNRMFQCNSCNLGMSMIAGFRFIDLQEDVSIAEQSQAINGSTVNFGVPFFDPASISVVDRFATRDQFYGGQIGFRAAAAWRSLFFAVQGKLAMGCDHEVVTISGISTLNTSNATNNGNSVTLPPTTVAVGRFAAPTNIGTSTSNRFCLAPEMETRLGISICQNVLAYVGYNFLYMSHVARAADQIDRDISLTQIPTAFEYNPAVAGTRPIVPFNQTYFWAQGIDIGMEITY